MATVSLILNFELQSTKFRNPAPLKIPRPSIEDINEASDISQTVSELKFGGGSTGVVWRILCFWDRLAWRWLPSRVSLSVYMTQIIDN